MILAGVEREILAEKGRGGLVYPYYGRLCISDIPPAILSLFGVETGRPALPSKIFEGWLDIDRVSKVVLMMIDGVSYDLWGRCTAESGFLNRLAERGVVTPLTSVFPSTTAASLTSMSTGLTPQEHGLPEWVVYFDEIDMVVKTLPFTGISAGGDLDLARRRVDPGILYQGPTVYQQLRDAGVRPVSLLHKSYASSPYSLQTHKGGEIVHYLAATDLIVNLRKRLMEQAGPAYIYAYYDMVDAMGHEYGPSLEVLYAELSSLSHLIERELVKKVDMGAAEETLLIITSDHGQIEVSPAETIYLNDHKELLSSLRRGSNGRPIPPTGSPRDVFLHIDSGKIDRAYEYLKAAFAGKALVIRAGEALEKGLFGTGSPTERFRRRVGDILLLPQEGRTIWYKHRRGEEFASKGFHGGLSRDEMLIPFAAAHLSSLR